MRLGNGLRIPAFAGTGSAGMTDKRKCCHSREGGNPWFSGYRTFALHLAQRREMTLEYACATLSVNVSLA